MRFVSLFTGIGGIDLGLERAGWECVAQVENDPWCCTVLTKHWPTVPKWGDIHDLDPTDLPDADAVVGGFPCQPVSQAGLRQAQDDPRWLWPEFFRIVRHVRPRYVIVENVPGLASAGMGDILGDLASIGYDAEWQSIPAAAVGAPHLRWRIFIVAYPDGGRLEIVGFPQHGEQQSTRRDLTDGRSARRRWDRPDVADPDGTVERPAGSASETLHRPETIVRPRRRSSSSGDHWAVEPDVGRVAHGVPRRVDRLRGLGNAVVPQVAEWVGRRINNYPQ